MLINLILFSLLQLNSQADAFTNLIHDNPTLVSTDTIPVNEIIIPDGALEFQDEDDVYKVVEDMPRYPGCESHKPYKDIRMCSENKRLKYLYSNLTYPAEARDKAIEGTAVISFIVEKNGLLSSPKILRDPGAGCGDAALNVVEMMIDQKIKWIPGKQRGVPVRVEFVMPVKFKLE